MTMIRKLAAALAVGVALTAAIAPVQAQEARRTDANGEPLLQVVVRPDPDRARRTELAQRLIRLSAGPNFQKDMDAMIASQIAQLETSGQNRREAEWVRANAPRMLSALVEQITTDLAPRYAAIFTADELEAQIAFYESPMGRRIAGKSILVGQASQEVLSEHLQTFVTELATKYCAQFDCEATGAAAAKPQRR
ncbi:DUF2059 domain-containing protein [Brevundimonas sp. SORGH_AS_0993]|uniref:DUF2059 domain-containing protein n=1 Tax=Brevundimonas sp. SORGH_AS_0993 TaxID=3041794 RepID=UPI00278AA1F7|nr:DUF2059 domain-containing protein [Brevundimonas sp. SORGH_AS_0993]MDQ1153930.1 hypothetical protein [Brevundimonas sp. SORGH_AS_0993]